MPVPLAESQAWQRHRQMFFSGRAAALSGNDVVDRHVAEGKVEAAAGASALLQSVEIALVGACRR